MKYNNSLNIASASNHTSGQIILYVDNTVVGHVNKLTIRDSTGTCYTLIDDPYLDPNERKLKNLLD